MGNLPADRVQRLRKILTKKLGRVPSDEEIEATYKRLLEFGIALVGLDIDRKNNV